MANSPHPETVTVCFTLPRQLAEAVNALAKRKMTNKSDIIRRAILDYLPSEQSAQIVEDVALARSTLPESEITSLDRAGEGGRPKQTPVENFTSLVSEANTEYQTKKPTKKK